MNAVVPHSPKEVVALAMQSRQRGLSVRRVLTPTSHNQRDDFLACDDEAYHTISKHVKHEHANDLLQMAEDLTKDHEEYMQGHRIALRKRHRRASVSNQYGSLSSTEIRDVNTMMRKGQSICAAIDLFCKKHTMDQARINSIVAEHPPEKRKSNPLFTHDYTEHKEENPYDHAIVDAYSQLRQWRHSEKATVTGKTWPQFMAKMQKECLGESTEYRKGMYLLFEMRDKVDALLEKVPKDFSFVTNTSGPDILPPIESPVAKGKGPEVPAQLDISQKIETPKKGMSISLRWRKAASKVTAVRRFRSFK